MVTPELINFIRGELNKGKTRLELEKELFMQGGWKTTDVAEAFRAIDGVAMPMYKKPSLHKGRGWVILALFLIGGYAGWWIRDRQQFFTILKFPGMETEINAPVSTSTQQSFTKELAESLVRKNWGEPTSGEGYMFSVTIAEVDQYTYDILAFYGQPDDSVSAIKKQGKATFQNGAWTLSAPTITTVCQPGREGSNGICI